MGGWRFFIDRGGTFTDIVAHTPDGRTLRHKLLSECPERYADAALQGISELLGRPPAPGDIAAVRMGTTVATNALLERRGVRTALCITRGLEDALLIGDQTRPDLFALHIQRPPPLYERVISVDERLGADGRVLRPLDEAAARRDLHAARAAGCQAVAIVLLHAYRAPGHETRLAAIAREVGFEQVSVSHEVSALWKLVPRGDTTVADAYLGPVLDRYVEAIRGALGPAPLHFMQSSGGLAAADRFFARHAILSGPAGGVVGAAQTCRQAGFDRIIAFDMGGTSTDVSHCAGPLERTLETRVAGVRLRVPMLDIHTVAAGGGSVCHLDGGRFVVGPDSAGADPGPACYRRGGPLTVTDCNVLLGHLRPERFPHVFGPGADQPLDVDVVRTRFRALAAEVSARTGRPTTPAAVADGFIRVAVETMARAIKRVSTERGHDVREGYALCCFGGAGGQHACRVADALGMRTVVVPPDAGVLSAWGIGRAAERASREQSVERALDPGTAAALDATVAALTEAAGAAVGGEPQVVVRAHVRLAGADTALEVPYGPPDALRSAFSEAHAHRFGFLPTRDELVVATLSAEAIRETATPLEPPPPSPAAPPAPLRGGVHARDELPVGARIAGPAVITEATATTVVERGWTAEVHPTGHLILRRTARRATPRAPADDPALLGVFNHRLMAVAEEMGVVLEHTAHSVNIKERRDYSCAVFDAAGRLIANAPHIPVHLGSMGQSVRAVIAARGDRVAPGDAFLLNDPYRGGTHLPDVTVVSPVFAGSDAAPALWVASRGHHADVGGVTPGSMPPHSTRIGEEGVLASDLQAVAGGVLRETALRAWLGSGPHPARSPEQNLWDIGAQLAANRRGALGLQALVADLGAPRVRACMAAVRAEAAGAVRQLLGRLRDGRFRLESDDGVVIQVAVTVDRAARRAVIDFAGSSPQQATNANAPEAVCRAVVLYVFRALVGRDLPLNEGCLEPLELRIPPGSVLSPQPPAAVVAGNVETSQLVADALLGALGAQAGSQGTMNNLTFGDATHQYYETLCGGTGAGPGFPGADAVHSHMTNSRLTDPEVLEARFPVRVLRFGVRRGSGGAGRFPGGCGAVRELAFDAPVTVSLLAGRRRVAPHGLAGGGSGAPGRDHLRRADGRVEPLAARATVAVAPGDVLVVETPGGGGFGAATAGGSDGSWMADDFDAPLDDFAEPV